MKIVKQSIIGILLASVSISCQFNEGIQPKDDNSSLQTETAKDISPQEFQKLIGENSIVLDVRTADEYNAGHLEGAVNIDFFSTNFMDEVLKLDKSKILLIHCASGGRSSKAMSQLSGKGFNYLYNMLGGFGAWKQSNLPIVK